MADYFFSREARIDLLEIWEYIARDNIDAADRVLTQIEEATNKLASNPEMGHRRRDLTTKEVRFWTVHSYLIIYKAEVQPLEIVRVLSGYRDVAGILQS